MGSPWAVSAWAVHSQFIDLLPDSPRTVPWVTHGQLMICLWEAHAHPISSSWSAHGHHIGIPRAAHGLPMRDSTNNVLSSHRHPLGSPGQPVGSR